MAKKAIEIKCKGAGELAITQLTPLQGAFKVLTEDNAQRLRRELVDDGFIEPISVWEDPESAKTYILNGHQRYTVLMDLRADGYAIPQLPVNFVTATDLNDAKRKILALASQYGSVSTTGLSSLLSELGIEIEAAQEFLNFPEIDLAAMMSGLSVPLIIGQEFETNPIIAENDVFTLERDPSQSQGEDDEDEIPEVKKSRVKLGQIWQLGSHRLLCGSATKIDDVERLIGGETVEMVFTDPPYGIDVVNVNTSTVGGSKAFGTVGAKNGSCKRIIKAGVYRPIIGDSTTETAISAYKICEGLGIKVLCFWGANYYASALPDKKKWIFWDKETTGNFSDGELAWTSLEGRVQRFKHTWNGLIKESERGERRVHPTQKPVALAEWCFEQLNPKGSSVLDLFGGSGSTLIACEKTKRKCLMMELDPYYCTVIIERWEAFSGKKAEVIAGSQPG